MLIIVLVFTHVAAFCFGSIVALNRCERRMAALARDVAREIR